MCAYNMFNDENDDERGSFKNQTSSQRAEISLGSSLPVKVSVHILGGLESNEMDWEEDGFDFNVLVTSYQ